MVCPNQVYAGSNKTKLVYAHPTAKQCDYNGVDTTEGTISTQVGTITLPNYSTSDAFFTIVDGASIRNVIGYKNLTRVSYPEMLVDITITGSWYSSGTIYCFVSLSGYDSAVSSSDYFVLPKYAVCTGGSEIQGNTYTITIPAADALCVPGTPIVSSSSSTLATCSMTVHFSSSSKITWKNFVSISVRNPSVTINYTQLNF